MPRKRNTIPQRRRYSRDLKSRIVYQAHSLGRKTSSIAIDLDIPLRVVQRTLEVWRDHGDVVPPPKGRSGQPMVLRGLAVDFMLALIEREPDIYLDEIQNQLCELHDLHVSLPTISRTLKRLGFSSKKLSKAASERSEEASLEFTAEVGRDPPEYFVCADEASVNVLTSYRENGWAYHGLRARKRARFTRGTRYSILPALSIEGIIYSRIKVGSYNGDDFLDWLDGLLEVMNPYPAPHSVLVLDNCRIHHVEGVEERCLERGIKLVYLPPYSPDLNPIEECFSFIKHYIRRFGDEFRECVESDDAAAPFGFLYHALDHA
ncbi:hypothetical protein ONZ45_g12957 [Pleurotus djamor]|nr:hypothetical protein ONZ45_g12957 [Pleurotus djamor]